MFKLVCDRCGLVDTFSEQEVERVHSIRLDNVHYNLCSPCFDLMAETMAEGVREDATDTV